MADVPNLDELRQSAHPSRRRYLCVPGESLSPGSSPIESLLRFGECVEHWKVPPRVLLSTPVCAVPLPALPAGWVDGDARWADIEPGALWHPLLWLPPFEVERRWVDAGDEVELEEDDLWAVRLCCELLATGLYDEESGTWYDVTAGVGIDLSTPDGIERVQRWLAGGRDDSLGSIDLTDLFADTADPDLALDMARQALPDLWHYTWALGAASMLNDLDEIRSDVLSTTDGRDPEGAVSDLSMIAAVGKDWLANLPAELSPVLDEAGWWDDFARRVKAFSGSRQGFAETIVDSVIVHLEAVREATFPFMERRIAELEASIAASN